MKSLKIFGAATLGAFTMAAPAHAALIDFTGFAAGTTFTDPLDLLGASFTSSTGTLMIKDLGAGNSLCAFDGNGCAGNIIIRFDSLVNAPSFTFSGDDMVGSEIGFEGQGPEVSFGGFLFGDGDPTTTGGTQLGSSGVNLMRIKSNDPNGIVLTTLGFTPNAAAVPEPATWAMMLLGFGALGATLRRRRATVTFASQAA